jgi:hypothetical protein
MAPPENGPRRFAMQARTTWMVKAMSSRKVGPGLFVPKALIFVGILAASLSNAQADDRWYYPHVTGAHAGVADGVLTGYGLGNHSGTVLIRQPNGKTLFFYVAAPPVTFGGEQVDCAAPPRPPHYIPSHDMCRHWPSNVALGRTRVRVFYWRGKRFGKPTLVTNKLAVIR